MILVIAKDHTQFNYHVDNMLIDKKRAVFVNKTRDLHCNGFNLRNTDYIFVGEYWLIPEINEIRDTLSMYRQ